MHCWVWCCSCGLHHVCWWLCVDGGCSECCGSLRTVEGDVWTVTFARRMAFRIDRKLYQNLHKFKAELLLSQTDAMQSCTFWAWLLGLLCMLVVIPSALIWAGHDAVCSCTCWQWCSALLYMLAMILCFLACACHNTIYSCMWLPQYYILLYLLATILNTPVCACHITEYCCTC